MTTMSNSDFCHFIRYNHIFYLDTRMPVQQTFSILSCPPIQHCSYIDFNTIISKKPNLPTAVIFTKLLLGKS